MSNFNSLYYFIPELVIILFILVIILCDLWPKTKQYTFSLTLISIVLSGCFLAITYGNNYALFSEMICIDKFSHYFKYIFLLATFSIILVSKYDDKLVKEYWAEYNILLLTALLGLFLMSSSINLIMIYISIELVSIPSYILAGINKNDKESTEASLKYVIFGSFASGLMLYGLSMIYGITGSTSIVGVADALQNIEFPVTLYFPMILILVGFGYKISMAPFHYWTPDVYEGAPTPIAAYLSVAPKAAGLAILIRTFHVFYTLDGTLSYNGVFTSFNWPIIIAISSALTMTIGNVLAIQQKDVKRILAYSSISHVGFMLMAFTVVTPEAIRAIMLYLFIYLFMNLSAFYMVIFASNQLNAHELDDWIGIGRKNSLLGAFMTLSLLSLTGLPPTAGFIGKFYIFAEIFKNKQFYWLAIVGILNSVVALYYYFNIVKSMYLVDIDTDFEKVKSYPVIKWSILVLSSQNILFFIYWEPLVNFINNSLQFWNN